MIKKATIFCSSSDTLPKKYYEETRLVGELLAKNDITIIYGGGSSGLMGTVADSALENGGEVVGVIPRFMKAVEWDHKGVHLMIETEDMAERKKIMVEGTDAVIALPGGVGTFEELFEVLSAYIVLKDAFVATDAEQAKDLAPEVLSKLEALDHLQT